MSIPPYLYPDGKGPTPDEPPPRAAPRRGASRLVVVAVCAAACAVVVAYLATDEGDRTAESLPVTTESPSITAPGVSGPPRYPILDPFPLDGWTIEVKGHTSLGRGAADVVTVRVVVTNTAAGEQTFVPESVDLGYVDPRNRYHEVDAANARSLAARRVRPSETAELLIDFRTPFDASGLRLILRGDHQQGTGVAALVNLTCC